MEGIDYVDALVKDAIAFVRYFGYPISQSAPHIYISALPFAPSSSVIAKHYLGRYPRTLRLEKGRLTKWPALEMTIPTTYGGIVQCIAWSRDGSRIAAATQYWKIYVWDARTGATVRVWDVPEGSDFALHPEDVSSIACSHNGRWLAFCSHTGTIRMWNTMKGNEKVKNRKPSTVKRHKGPVSALSFSQDSRKLVSGSVDCTVLVWNSIKGTVVAGPFEGHKSPIWEVSLIPMADQGYIVSRSGLCMLLVWNVEKAERTNMEISIGTIDTYNLQFYFNLVEVTERSGFTPCWWPEVVEDNAPQKAFILSDFQRPVSNFSVMGGSTSHPHLVWRVGT